MNDLRSLACVKMPIVVEDGVGGHCQDHDARSVSSCMPANCYLEIGKCAAGFKSQFTNSCVGFLQFPQFLGNFCHSTPTLVWDDQQWCLLHQKTEKKKDTGHNGLHVDVVQLAVGNNGHLLLVLFCNYIWLSSYWKYLRS